jgi:hypothetical protein
MLEHLRNIVSLVFAWALDRMCRKLSKTDVARIHEAFDP